jgi:hypothetical protein
MWRDLRGVLSLSFCLVREQVGGVLSSAAVPRGGLWPPTPPLCRCAEYTADQLLRPWWAINRCAQTLVGGLGGGGGGGGCVRRSGIKEESLALGQHGGQPRSRTHQAPGRTQALVRNPHAFKRKKMTARFNTNGICSSEQHWIRPAPAHAPAPALRSRKTPGHGPCRSDAGW